MRTCRQISENRSKIYIVYSVEALDRKDRKVPEALESPSVESVRCGQKLHFRSHCPRYRVVFGFLKCW